MKRSCHTLKNIRSLINNFHKGIMRYIISAIGLFCIQLTICANPVDSLYQVSFTEINKMLSNNNPNFRRGVFLAEKAYYEGAISEKSFDDAIWFYSSLCREVMLSGNIDYSEKDKEIANIQCATYILMTDTISLQLQDNTIKHSPFSYNHEDYAGQKDWSNMFVSTLIQTKKVTAILYPTSIK